jgi:hypothetical protein
MKQFGIWLETCDFLKKTDFVDQILKIVRDGICDFVQLIVFSGYTMMPAQSFGKKCRTSAWSFMLRFMVLIREAIETISMNHRL